jgi:hypothetical protein
MCPPDVAEVLERMDRTFRDGGRQLYDLKTKESMHLSVCLKFDGRVLMPSLLHYALWIASVNFVFSHTHMANSLTTLRVLLCLLPGTFGLLLCIWF